MLPRHGRAGYRRRLDGRPGSSPGSGCARRTGRAAARIRADLRRALEPHLQGLRRSRRRLGAAPPPLGKRLASAHDMGREFRIIAALRRHRGPGARPTVGLCEDDGRSPSTSWTGSRVRSCARSRTPSEFPDEAERRAIGERVVDTLVAIHAVDPDAVGLGELAKKEDYVARQLHRWQGQWEKQHTRELPLIEEVHDRLAARIPEQGPATIVHGDYRLDNMILTPRRRGRRGRRLGAVHARRPARRRRPAARLLGRGGRSADPAARAGDDGAGVPGPRRGGRALRGALGPRPLADRLLRRPRRSGSWRSSSRASSPATRRASTAKPTPTRAAAFRAQRRAPRTRRRRGGAAAALSSPATGRAPPGSPVRRPRFAAPTG